MVAIDSYIIGRGVKEIETPALLLDLVKVEDNLQKMAGFLKEKKTYLRPHFKTHKSPFLAHKQMEAGAIGISCQKLAEAEVLAKSGLKDILITNQIAGRQKIKRMVNLARYTDLKIAIDNLDNAREISEAALVKGIRVSYLVEIDIGMNRAGVTPGQPALKLINEINKLSGLVFLGIMAYEGHTVFIKSYQARKSAVLKALAKVSATRDLLSENGIECKIISCGGTGTYSITGSYPAVTEIEAGSYLTMDTKYDQIEGIGSEFKKALSILTTIVSRPDPERVIVDLGLKSVSQEFGWPTIKAGGAGELYQLSEEHGLIKLSKGRANLYRIGQKIELIPSHGCTTINLHELYYGIRDGIVESVLPIAARGKFY